MIDPIIGLAAAKGFQALTRSAASAEEEQDTQVEETADENKPAEGGSFDTMLRGLLIPDQANNVSEEDLFAAIVQERISKIKGGELTDQFKNIFEEKKNGMRRPDGFVSMEGAATAAIQALQQQGVLTEEEADKIYSESFDAAQLDTNTGALFDSRGGAGDPTMAIDKLESALLAARTKVEQYEDGSLTPTMRHVADQPTDGRGGAVTAGASTAAGAATGTPITPQGTVVDGPNGFLFKPVSSNEGTLAVLLPEALAHMVSSLVLRDPTGSILEEGHSTGYGDLGTREKFSFTKPGQEYPSDLVVEATLNDGTVQTWSIPDPAQRYD